mmetsp:Transcript_36937/g.66444  ORF Transcript_36937/g.66444 Transcript_36937/m.66444 type:complete len:80 (-) Transcript_36937:492-731(-)
MQYLTLMPLTKFVQYVRRRVDRYKERMGNIILSLPKTPASSVPLSTNKLSLSSSTILSCYARYGARFMEESKTECVSWD